MTFHLALLSVQYVFVVFLLLTSTSEAECKACNGYYAMINITHFEISALFSFLAFVLRLPNHHVSSEMFNMHNYIN